MEDRKWNRILIIRATILFSAILQYFNNLHQPINSSLVVIAFFELWLYFFAYYFLTYGIAQFGFKGASGNYFGFIFCLA